MGTRLFCLFALLLLPGVLTQLACGSVDEVSLEPGRWVKNIQDNHLNVASAADCCTLCENKPKCRHWSYRSNRNHCKTHGSGAVSKGQKFWSRPSTLCNPPNIAFGSSSGCNQISSGTTCDVTCDGGYSQTGDDPVCGSDGQYTSLPTCVACNSTCPPLNSGSNGAPCPVNDLCGNGCPDHCQSGCCGSSSCCCFAASSLVHILKGNETMQVRLDQLSVGDKILSVDDFGRITFQEMYYEPHKFPSTRSEDVVALRKIVYDGGFVSISDLHMMYISSPRLLAPHDHCITYQETQICVYPAKMLDVGDTIWVADESNGFNLKPELVAEISTVHENSRSPKVMNVNIIVNNVLCSSQTDHHDAEFASFSVFRLIYAIDTSILETRLLAELWENTFITTLRHFPRELAKNYDVFGMYASCFVYLFYLSILVICVGGVQKICGSLT